MSDYATDVAKAAFRAGFLQSTEAFNAEYVGPDKLSGEAKWSELMGWAGLLAIIDGGPSPAPAWWVNVKNEFTFRHDTSAYDYPVYPVGELRPLYTVPGGYPCARMDGCIHCSPPGSTPGPRGRGGAIWRFHCEA